MAWSKDSIVHLLEVDSTNRYVRDEAAALWQNRGISDFAVVTAGHQTAGRGQIGNTWNSNAGENLLFSILVRPGETLEVSKQFLLSQAVALSIHDAMKCHGIDTQLKWPNDIYAGNRKLAGILLELDYSGAFVEQAIIGIGLNVNQENFPPMDRTPVSMKMLRKRDFILDDVLATILDLFEHYYTEMRFGNRDAIAAEYKRVLLGMNERHTFIDRDGHFDAVIQDIESDGHLILRRNDGSTGRYAFKEVEMVL
jgi:BirA family biotin operon repressor/biotin-[acetyl-CoA-carboxylase] ligase